MYTPPAGNAVFFDFSTAGYMPPAGNDVVLEFDAAPPPSGAMPVLFIVT